MICSCSNNFKSTDYIALGCSGWFNHLSTGLVRYSDHHCIDYLLEKGMVKRHLCTCFQLPEFHLQILWHWLEPEQLNHSSAQIEAPEQRSLSLEWTHSVGSLEYQSGRSGAPWLSTSRSWSVHLCLELDPCNKKTMFDMKLLLKLTLSLLCAHSDSWRHLRRRA